MNLLQRLYRPVVAHAARAAFVGKNRMRNDAERGRFTSAEVNNFVREAWRQVNQMAPNLHDQPTLGSRMNVMLACLCYSMLTVLLARGIEREYVIELIADVAWNVYRKWAVVPKLMARFATHDPSRRMNFCVNAFLRFPFNPPGYEVERLASGNGIAFNILSCPVARYFAKQGAADLCVGSWCNQDFALAEMWGGRLQRTGTLAGGASHCDFRFGTALSDMARRNSKKGVEFHA